MAPTTESSSAASPDKKWNDDKKLLLLSIYASLASSGPTNAKLLEYFPDEGLTVQAIKVQMWKLKSLAKDHLEKIGKCPPVEGAEGGTGEDGVKKSGRGKKAATKKESTEKKTKGKKAANKKRKLEEVDEGASEEAVVDESESKTSENLAKVQVGKDMEEGKELPAELAA